MKKILFLASATLLFFSACNNSTDDASEIERLREEAIAIHDEIMPQISAFDRNTIKIDSLLLSLPQLKEAYPDMDTTQTQADLTGLKSQLEQATDAMMDWMTEFEVDPQDKSTTEIKAYYEEEVKKVKGMKLLFEEASKASTDKLAQF